MNKIRVHVCAGAGCVSCGCKEISDAFIQEVNACGLNDKIDIITTGCIGSCNVGPVAVVYPETTFYEKLTVDGVKKIVSEHLAKGEVVKEFLHVDGD